MQQRFYAGLENDQLIGIVTDQDIVARGLLRARYPAPWPSARWVQGGGSKTRTARPEAELPDRVPADHELRANQHARAASCAGPRLRAVN